jgi:hypothetical protein
MSEKNELKIAPDQAQKTGERLKGRNLKKEEVKDFIIAFTQTVKAITINGKPFANKVTPKVIGTNPDLTVEEINKTLNIDDSSKVDFVRQLYVRGGSSLLRTVFPEEVIVNLPTVSFTEEGNAIYLSY